MSDADLVWMRVIYRSLDLTNEQNMALYYPEEPTENQENLFRIIMRSMANNQGAAHKYRDGREVFTDHYKTNAATPSSPSRRVTCLATRCSATMCSSAGSLIV